MPDLDDPADDETDLPRRSCCQSPWPRHSRISCWRNHLQGPLRHPQSATRMPTASSGPSRTQSPTSSLLALQNRSFWIWPPSPLSFRSCSTSHGGRPRRRPSANRRRPSFHASKSGLSRSVSSSWSWTICLPHRLQDSGSRSPRPVVAPQTGLCGPERARTATAPTTHLDAR